MPGTGYDREAESIGLNIAPRQRRLGLIVFVVSVYAGMLLASLAKADTAAVITGQATAKDGDSILVGALDLRLFGIDAPEWDQKCQRADGSSWACGLEAKRELAALVDGQELRCLVVDVEKTGGHRPIVRCFDGEKAISEELIQRGLARVFDRYVEKTSFHGPLKLLEADAQARHIGIWQGESQAPWQYRAQKWDRYAARAPNGCPIIANEKSRIYHTPWSKGFPRIFERWVIEPDAKGHRWFCDDRQAAAEGFRPSR